MFFRVWCIATLVFMANSSAFIDSNMDSLFSPNVEFGYEDGNNGLLFNPDFSSFDNNQLFSTDVQNAFSDPNENIFNDFAIAANNPNECSPLGSLSRKKFRTRQPSEESCNNSNNPVNSQNPTSDIESLKTSQQEYWCSKSAMLGFGNIPVCEEQPFNTIPSEAFANPHASPPFPDPAGFATLLQCELLDRYEAQHGHPCPRNHVFCCNGWLPGPPGTEPDEFGMLGNRDGAGWGYWCWPSDQSGLFQGPPPEWSDILRTFEVPPSGS